MSTIKKASVVDQQANENTTHAQMDIKSKGKMPIQTDSQAQGSAVSPNYSMLVASVIVITAIIIGLRGTPISIGRSHRCRMNLAENREFNRYFGLEGLTNHFTNPAADGCHSRTIFRPALPQAVLKADHSASSFLILARYGTGKTLLRCEYAKMLSTDKYFTVTILNKEVDEYLTRYVRSQGLDDQSCQAISCLSGWSSDEFAQLALSILATNLVNSYEKGWTIFDNVPIAERIELITIICYYYNGYGTSQLEDFVNAFLNESKQSPYKASAAQIQFRERDVYYEKELFVHYKENLKRLRVLDSDNINRLHLLLAIVEGEEFTREAKMRNMTSNVFDDLTKLSLFIKTTLKRSVVFIVDGIDENRYFFQGREVKKSDLETFGRSSVSQELVGRIMANHFYLSIFYPRIPQINIEDAIIRKDKFPKYEITWNTKALINYADYILQELDKTASRERCKAFRDFKTLVNYSNKNVAAIVDKLTTPRALHYFMSELIVEMNNDAGIASPPFVASLENVHNAYEKAYQHSNQWLFVKD